MQLAPALQRALRRWPVGVQDGLLAAVLAASALLPGLSGTGILLAQLDTRNLDALGVLLVLGQCVPLVVRRRLPVGCLAVIGAAFAAHQLLGYPATSAALGLFAALYSVGAHLDRGRTTTAFAAAAGYAGLAVAAHARGSAERPLDYLTFAVVLAGCWTVGAVVRSRAAGENERERLVAEAAVATERARIAAELHDVVTHHVTAMVVQADAAGVLLDTAPSRAAAGLTAIGDTGRTALTELRALLGVLNPDPGERAPTGERIADLVARVRAAGQPVELTETGAARPIASAAELAAHRVVQEALTNALRHAPGAPTTVAVHRGADGLSVQVVTGAPTGVPQGRGGGRGLAGLAERVRLVGGSLAAGPRTGGGFAVRADIPIGSSR